MVQFIANAFDSEDSSPFFEKGRGKVVFSGFQEEENYFWRGFTLERIGTLVGIKKGY